MNKNNKLLKGGGDKFGPVSVPYGSSRELDKALTEGPTELAKKSTLYFFFNSLIILFLLLLGAPTNNISYLKFVLTFSYVILIIGIGK